MAAASDERLEDRAGVVEVAGDRAVDQRLRRRLHERVVGR